MTDLRYMTAPRERHDELHDEIDQFLSKEADFVGKARPVIHLISRFLAHHHANGNRASLPSVSTLHRRLARSLAQQQIPNVMNRLHARFAATPKPSAVRLLVEDPAKRIRRPHARPTLYVDPYTGAIISAS
ncbi:hypothetical protein EDF63_0769 [Curtobacterium sp. JUb34]|uniref:hypothetical protein n=1 Tax=Curtobacterium sp. JUb34 TaxID=2485109 RepID=UPI000FB16741|nr:hypothetical protein [Curtobacterium sp. JUb34]ROR36639.1 hypothetical protein EDF63_0769 [Curtobacterium sp. JUb34]